MSLTPASPAALAAPGTAAVSVGVSLPQVFPHGAPEPAAIAAYAGAAERFGFGSLWVQSQLISRIAVLDPVTELAFAAAATSQIGLGTSVLIATEYHPVQLAKQLSTIDYLSGGRLTVGLGLGSPNSTYEIQGMDRDRQVRRLLESVAVMRALWSELELNHDGETYRFHGLTMEPKPVQPSGPPIWLGGRGDQALRRAARHGAGWMGPGASTLEMFTDQVARLTRARDEAGLADQPFAIAKRLYVTVDDDEQVARERMRTRLQRYDHPHEHAEEVAAYGTPEQVAQRLAEVAGVLDAIELPGERMLMLSPIHDFDAQLEAVAELVSAGATSAPGAAGAPRN